VRKILKKTLSISLALLFICICFNRSNTAFAQSDTALYDLVWKLVNAKFLDDTKNSQDWERWRHKYDDKIKTPEDAYVAIDTMLASLNDRYTKFVPPKEFEEEKSMIKGSLFGIGVQIGIRDGKILVISPIEDTPGEKAGLKPEDEILSIDGFSTKDMTVDKAADKIRGKKGSEVTLIVKRKGEPENLTFKIIRDEIIIKSISVKLPEEFKLDDKLAYIRISSFMGKNSSEDFRKELLKVQDKEGVIIDLRANSGGLLSNAIQIADMFLYDDLVYDLSQTGLDMTAVGDSLLKNVNEENIVRFCLHK
jgi:carboxyl-terminal processing protease